MIWGKSPLIFGNTQIDQNQKGVSEVTFGAAVAACEKAGEWKFALNLISLAREAGLVGGILARWGFHNKPI